VAPRNSLRSARVQVRWGSAALFSLLSLLLTGYVYEGQDNDLWIPFIRHAADPGLLARDPAIGSPHAALSLYVDALAALSRAVPLEWCFALVVGAAAVAVALRSRALASRASLLRPAALAVPALFVAVLGTRPIDVPWAPRQRDDAGLARWARTHTPVDTLFAVPVTASGFRHDGSIDVLVLGNWARRLQEPVAYEDAAYVAYVRPGSPLAASPP